MIDVNTFMKKYMKGEIKREDFIISFLGIIEPIPYDMSENQFLFEDFGLIFWSTDFKTREKHIEDIEKTTNQLIDSTFTIFIDGDDILNDLHEYCKTTFEGKDVQTRLNLYYKGYNLLLKLLLVNIAVAKKQDFYLSTFENSFIDKIKRYWVYAGTKKRTLNEIINLNNDLIDSIKQKKGNKNAFGPIILEKKKEMEIKRK